MTSNWFTWGMLAAIGTSIWNLTLLNSPKVILQDPFIKSIYLRIIIVIAGILSACSLIMPKIGITANVLKVIKTNSNSSFILWSAFVLALYQVLLIYAFSSGGPLAQSMVNLNIIFMVIYGMLYMNQKTDKLLWSMLSAYAILGMYINYYNNTVLK